MSSIINNLEIIFVVIVNFNKGVDLLADFGMTSVVRNLKDLDIVVIYLIENFV